MKIRVVIIAVMLMGIAAVLQAASLQGPVLATNPDVTCPQATGTGTPGVAMPQSTPAVGGNNVTNRMCAEFDWVSGSPVRLVESAAVTADKVLSPGQGIPIAAATSAAKTLCIDGPVFCFGIGGTAVIAPNQVNRQ